MKPIILLCLMTLLAVSQPSKAEQTIYLIRHAEKADPNAKDPILSEAGSERANHLVELFKQATPNAIFTTQFQRTQLTAAPLSKANNVPITVLAINAENSAQYPALLLKQICVLPKNANVLVVGHSNSIPAIVEAWSQKPVKAIADEEYDRFFVIQLKNCTVTSSLDLRYE